MTTCEVAECARPVRSAKAVLCEMHYYRLRRTGTTDQIRKWTRCKGQPCSIDGCDGPAATGGLCNSHYDRQRRRGDVMAPFIPHADRAMPRMAKHYAWRGAEASYPAAHTRLTRLWGAARQYVCIACSAPARHWAYMHDDPTELRTDDGMPYSAWPEFYAPMCVPCHKRFDLDWIARPADIPVTRTETAA